MKNQEKYREHRQPLRFEEMNDLMTIVINPDGQRQTVKIAEAIMIIDEKNGKAEYSHG